MRKFQADQLVRELESEEYAWRRSMAEASQTIRRAQWQIQDKETALTELHRLAQVAKTWNEQITRPSEQLGTFKFCQLGSNVSEIQFDHIVQNG